MAKVIVACVGGFLGAGKSTALVSAAQDLGRRGLRFGIITNDQGTELVDTKVMEDQDVPTKEIGGGCFCCKFDDLVEQADQIIGRNQPDIILAEAVGSCTDLSATVYQPLRKYYGHRFDLAPLSILVEPTRLHTLLREDHGGFPATVQYLFKKQLTEADLIVLNKVELLSPIEVEEAAQAIRNFAGDIPVHRMSALTGQGVPGWVDVLLSRSGAGQRILDLDYDTYGRAEAALGWLNANVEVVAPHDCSPKEFAAALLGRIHGGAVETGMTIAHVKILVATETETDRLALTQNQGNPEWSGSGVFPAARAFSIVINARVHTDPQELRNLTMSSLMSNAELFGVSISIEHLESFSPPPPRPRHRISAETV